MINLFHIQYNVILTLRWHCSKNRDNGSKCRVAVAVECSRRGLSSERSVITKTVFCKVDKLKAKKENQWNFLIKF